MNNQTRKITEGAMMVAIVGLLLFINRQLAGMIEVAMYWILTFPILIYTAKYGVKDSLVPAVSMVLLSFMIATPTTIFYLISCDVIGIIYGAGIRNKWKNGSLLWWTGIFTFVSYFVTTVLFAAVFGYDPNEDVEIIKTLVHFFNIDLKIPIAKIVGMVVIGGAILMTILQTMCIHMIANIILKRMKIEVRPMKSVFELRVPRYVGYIILGIIVLFYMQNVIELNQDVYAVLLVLYGVSILFAMGYGTLTLLCMAMVFRKKYLIIIIFICLFIPLLNLIIVLIGVLDMIMDLRTLWIRAYMRGENHGALRKH